jgi:hypothetical protein
MLHFTPILYYTYISTCLYDTRKKNIYISTNLYNVSIHLFPMKDAFLLQRVSGFREGILRYYALGIDCWFIVCFISFLLSSKVYIILNHTHNHCHFLLIVFFTHPPMPPLLSLSLSLSNPCQLIFFYFLLIVYFICFIVLVLVGFCCKHAFALYLSTRFSYCLIRLR